MRPKPLQDIRIYSQGYLLLFRSRSQAATNNSLGKHFRGNFRSIREINIFVLHSIQAFSISKRIVHVNDIALKDSDCISKINGVFANVREPFVFISLKMHG